jgi:hypothetical protein
MRLWSFSLRVAVVSANETKAEDDGLDENATNANGEGVSDRRAKTEIEVNEVEKQVRTILLSRHGCGVIDINIIFSIQYYSGSKTNIRGTNNKKHILKKNNNKIINNNIAHQ